MKQRMYTIYDSKAETYLPPFYFQSHRDAIHAVTQTVNDGTSTINSYPEDFTLFHIGEYDSHTASINMLEAKKSIGTLSEYKQ